MTLTAWLANFEKNIDEINKIVSPETIQIYRLYLNGCIGAFTHGDINLYQISYSNGLMNNSGVPQTNKYLHA
jgi:cyclopropane fatty-acyl-phospholipid synthase-like methyltransferase